MESAIFALIGAAIGAASVVLTQLINQMGETKRHLKMLAYEAAMSEWRTRTDILREEARAGKGGKVLINAIPELFVLNHLAWAEFINKSKASKVTVDDYKRFFMEREVTIAKMHAARESLKRGYRDPE